MKNISIATGILILSLAALGATSCQRDSRPENTEGTGLKPDERAAIILVHEGNGWLASGGEIHIAEWHSGLRGDKGAYYANFRGANGGATVDLRLAGLNGTGEFSCEALKSGLELRVDVRNTYAAAHGKNCKVVVTRFENGIMEGHYSAVLANTADAGDNIRVSGKFRATRPSQIASASAPRLGF